MQNVLYFVFACLMAGVLGLCVPSSAEARPFRGGSCGAGGCGSAVMVQPAAGGEKQFPQQAPLAYKATHPAQWRPIEHSRSRREHRRANRGL